MAENLSNADKLNAAFVSFMEGVSRTSDLVTVQQREIETVNSHAVQIAALIQNMTMQEIAGLHASFGQMLDTTDLTLQKGDQLQSLMGSMVQTTDQHNAQLDLGSQRIAHHNALLDVSAKKIQDITDLATRFSDVASSFAAVVEFAFIFIALMFGLLSSKWLLGERITCWFAAGLGTVPFVFEILIDTSADPF